MPPRLQCLDAVRVVRRAGSSRSAFSSTAAQHLENRPSSPAASLASIDQPDSTLSNPIKLPPTPKNEFRGVSIPRTSPRATSRVMELIQRAKENKEKSNAAQSAPQLSTAEELSRFGKAAALTKQISRRWKAGDVYAPHDLSPIEMEKWKKRGRPGMDALDVLGLNPLDEYKNFSMMSEYMTPMGRIEHSSNTGLRPVNQRRMAKAIRRAVGLGLMPSVHRHPEILRLEMTRRNEQMSRLRGPL